MTTPTSVLHYTILGRLGAGGMGVVHRALDTRLDRVVALKFLPDALATDAAARQRLVQEARAAARLDHPNIGAIYGIEGLDAEPFIVMAYYEGASLQEALAQGPMSVPDAVERTLQIVRGLECAHASGVTHRDIKPANVLLLPDGTIRILDFGLARSGALDGLTRPGEVVGTPAYLSPEQARGQSVDGRTDLWATGAVLYEMLTGVAPFASDAGLAAMLLRILRDEPELASRLRPDVPPSLDAIIARALAKDPEARYDSAREMIDDLEAMEAPTGRTPQQPATRAPAPPPPAAPPSDADIVGRRPPATLPVPSAPLVGREHELALAGVHLGDPHCRILTLFGPGGTGKTRLATESALAQERTGGYPDGVVFVPLEALEDDALIPMRIAVALGLTLVGEADVVTQVGHAIGSRRMLLVLDNYEHLMGGADVPGALVRACPALTILVTSRERLGLDEEWVLPLGGLETPPARAEGRDELLAVKAVQLFVQRAGRADVRFVADDDALVHIGDICRLVQGSPLGIELAAAWVKTLPCAEIAQEIRSSLDVLESTGRGKAERHRSLRATFEYSWALLGGKDREALARLSIFHGGFTREAAREVASCGLPQLASLADKSLVDTLPSGRYDFHPVVHHYAGEKLREGPEDLARVRAAHGTYFHHALRSRAEAMQGRDQAEVHAVLEAELPNLRAAWSWAADEGRLEELVASSKPLDLLLDNKGRHLEAAELFAGAVEALEARQDRHAAGQLDETLGVLLARHAWARYSLGSLGEARQLAERSVGLLRPLAGGPHLVAALNTLAAVEYAGGATTTARDLWLETLTLARQMGNRRHVAAALGNLASVENRLGDYAASKAHQGEALELAREGDDPVTVVHALNNMASVLVHLGALAEAHDRLDEALRLAREIGFDQAVPILLHSLAVVEFERHEYAVAEPLYEEALAIVRDRGDQAREAYILTSLGRLRLGRDDPDGAWTHLREAFRIAWSNENLPTALFAIVAFAQWHASHGHIDDAVAMLTFVHDHPAADRAVVEKNAASLTEWEGTLAPDALADARARGRALQFEELVERLVRRDGPPGRRL